MKVFLISHIADPDGVMPVILTDLTFPDYDYELLDIKDVEEFMINSINENKFDEYDRVFMTDLCISENVAEMIDKLPLKNKFQVLDHHYGNLSLNKYSFITVVDEYNGIKESGTSLYYKYLLANYNCPNIATEAVAYMTEMVRIGDTWDFKGMDIPEARQIGTLFFYYGRDRFINNYCNFLRKYKEFFFLESEKVLLEVDKNKKDSYFEFMKENIIIKEIKGKNVGIVFAEEYRSELGNYLAQELYDEVDLIAIINLNRSISYRCVKEDVNVSDFAEYFGGKGHVKAAGSPLPDNIKEIIIDKIFE